MFSDWTSLRKRLHGYLRTRMRADAVDDVLQDVLLKLHAHGADAPKDERASIAWALRVARNAAIDHHRTRRTTIALDPATVASRDASLTASSELADCLPRMVRLLPDGYRRAVEFADLRGWPQHLVAAELGVSTSGAKSRVQRGRQQLAAMLAQCCDIERDARGGVTDFEPTARATEFCGTVDALDGEPDKFCVHSRPASSSIRTAAMVAVE